MNSTPKTCIELNQITHQLKSIDEFGFSARVDLPAGVRGKGLLTLGTETLEIGFRVRENADGIAQCSFSNLSPTNSDLIKNFLRKRHRSLLEDAPNSLLDSDGPADDKQSEIGLAPQPEPPTNSDVSLPALVASNDPPANNSGTSIEPAANKWESSQSIQTSSPKTNSSAGYTPAVASEKASSQTVAPQAISQATVPQSADSQPPVPSPNTPDGYKAETIESVPNPPAPETVVTSTPATLAAAPEIASTPKSRQARSRSDATPSAIDTTTSTSDQSVSETDRVARPTKPTRRKLVLPLILMATGLCLIASYFYPGTNPRSPFASNRPGNISATETFLPVTVKAEGEVVELMVAKGDIVKKGDILMRLENQTLQGKKDQLAAQLATAKAENKALKRELSSIEKRIQSAGEKLSLDLAVAKSKLTAATENVEAAEMNFGRMKPAFDSGAITTLEFDSVRQAVLAAKANKVTAENAVKQIQFAQRSVKDNILILGERFDDEFGRLTSKIEIAAAKQNEVESALATADAQLANLNVKAPRDGRVSAVYRQVGELVKVADETVGLSFEADSEPHQHELNVEGAEADKVAAGM